MQWKSRDTRSIKAAHVVLTVAATLLLLLLLLSPVMAAAAAAPAASPASLAGHRHLWSTSSALDPTSTTAAVIHIQRRNSRHWISGNQDRSQMQLAALDELSSGMPGRAMRHLMATELSKPAPTPWGPAGAVILCLLPIAFLVLATVVKKVLLPTSISLPLAAAMLAFIRLAYLSTPTVLVASCCVSGLLEALTPLSIITGAIMLFQSMHHTKCLPWMMSQIKTLSAGHPVAEVFLIGFAFAYLVEGASGFGTPVALAAPMLSSLGHAPIPTVACLLIMNTLATQFGAVGTPIWFGFGDLNLGDDNLQLVGLKASVIIGSCAYVIAPIAATFLVPFRVLLRSSVFIILSISSAVAPAVLISLFSYEFPSLIGGLASVLLTALLIKFKIGLQPVDSALASLPAAAAAEGSSHHSQSHTVRRVASKKSGTSGEASVTSYRPTASKDTSESFSLIEDEGVVSHPPAATLDFPLTNAPTAYTKASRHDFAAQIDEQTIVSELAAPDDLNDTRLEHQGAQQHGNSDSITQHGSSSIELVGPPDVEQGEVSSSLSSSRQTVAAASAATVSATAKGVSNKTASSVRSKQHSISVEDDLPALTDKSPSGTMQLNPLDPQVAVKPRLTMSDLVLRTLGIWLTVMVLLLTRIPAIQLKYYLQSQSPSFAWKLGNFGTFGISASLVVFLKQILSEPSVNWRYEVLYVPFLLPFALASVMTVIVHRKDLEVHWTTPFREAFNRVAGITVATLGALVLVQLIRTGGNASPAFIIGYYFSTWLSQGFLAISAFLGALGSFFSGSTTVSNLTFGTIQSIAAASIGAPVTSMLAVQVAGATIGNMICINNILSAKAVMNMNHVSEGEFIKRTAPIALLFTIMAEAIGLIFTVGQALPDRPTGFESYGSFSA